MREFLGRLLGKTDFSDDRSSETPLTSEDLADHRPLAGAKILVVDDEPIVREVVADMLAAMGCTAITAENGEKALSVIDEEAPTAILLDLAMPGMNGAEVARMLVSRRPGARIVFATSFARNEAIDAGVGENAILLRKPFSPSALADAISKALAA